MIELSECKNTLFLEEKGNISAFLMFFLVESLALWKNFRIFDL